MGREQTAGQVEIILCRPADPSQELSLFYQPLATPIARKHFAALRECAQRGYKVKDPDRFHNFPGCHRDERWIVAELNRRIDLINAYAPGTIPHRATLDMPQEQMNRLHNYFERYRGSVLAPSEFFLRAPTEVGVALEDFNLLIHRYEDHVRITRGVKKWLGRLRGPHARAVLTFAEPRPRYPLEDDDFRHFSRRVRFGSLLINYCELGKPLLDYYRDRDEIIGDDNVRPLRYFSGDSILQFGPTTPYVHLLRERLRFDAWWTQNEQKLRSLGFRRGDPKNAIGHITVGMLDPTRGRVAGLSRKELLRLIGEHSLFKGIRA